MPRIKQTIIPVVFLVIGIAAFIGFSSMKKPPAEKPKKDTSPIVSIKEIKLESLSLDVNSYGVVQPKYETSMVAQVSGQIIELSPIFVRGGFVKEGTLLARIDPNDYDAALIDAQAGMATARASLESERALGKVAEQEWQKITHTSPTELSLRKPQLAKELARVKAAQASILRAQRNVDRTELRAPYDALIASRNIGLGSFVSKGTSIGKLLGTSVAEVRLPVADNQLKYLVNKGIDSSAILIGSYAGNKQIWQSTIARSEGVIDSKSRMSYLVAEISDPYNLGASVHKKPLRFGSYITAEVKGETVENAVVLPRHLVVNERVAILDESLKLQYVEIDILREDGSNVIVSSGLHEGDGVIVSALDFPINGMQLALVDSDLNDNEQEKFSEDEEAVGQLASAEKE